MVSCLKGESGKTGDLETKRRSRQRRQGGRSRPEGRAGTGPVCGILRQWLPGDPFRVAPTLRGRCGPVLARAGRCPQPSAAAVWTSARLSRARFEFEVSHPRTALAGTATAPRRCGWTPVRPHAARGTWHRV